jgi:sodium/bile acid cotransporter 7
MAAVLFPGHTLSLMVLPLMLFHQIQLMVCTVLARRWGRESTEPEAGTAGHMRILSARTACES